MGNPHGPVDTGLPEHSQASEAPTPRRGRTYVLHQPARSAVDRRPDGALSSESSAGAREGFAPPSSTSLAGSGVAPPPASSRRSTELDVGGYVEHPRWDCERIAIAFGDDVICLRQNFAAATLELKNVRSDDDDVNSDDKVNFARELVDEPFPELPPTFVELVERRKQSLPPPSSRSKMAAIASDRIGASELPPWFANQSEGRLDPSAGLLEWAAYVAAVESIANAFRGLRAKARHYVHLGPGIHRGPEDEAPVGCRCAAGIHCPRVDGKCRCRACTSRRSTLSTALDADGPAWPCRQQVAKCSTGTWVAMTCGSHVSQMFSGCDTHNCNNEECCEGVGSRRAKRIWNERADVWAKRWGVVVLTMPMHLRDRVPELGRRAMNRLAWETVEEWQASEGRRIGGVVFTHPVGSVWRCPDHGCSCEHNAAGDVVKNCGTHAEYEPFSAAPPCARCGQVMEQDDATDWHPHWNVLFPCVDVPREGEQRRTRAWPGWADADYLDSLKELWRRKLEVTFDVDVDVVNVHYRFKKREEEIRHALRYFARSFPGWGHWTTSVGGSGWGALSNRNYSTSRERIQRDGKSQKVTTFKLCCPDCMQDVFAVGVTVGIWWNGREVPHSLSPIVRAIAPPNAAPEWVQ